MAWRCTASPADRQASESAASATGAPGTPGSEPSIHCRNAEGYFNIKILSHTDDKQYLTIMILNLHG